MNILVICQYYYPEPFRITDICEELVKRGHAVTVVTGEPNYPEGRIYKGYEKHKRSDEVINGVVVHRCPIIPRKIGVVHRFLNYFSYSRKAKKYVRTSAHFKEHKYDVALVNQLSPVMMAEPAIEYKRIYKAPIVLYCLDLWPESLVAGGIGRHSIIYKEFHRKSKKIYKKADRILITSKGFAEYFRDEFGIDDVQYLPQFAEELFEPLPFKLPGEHINLVFAGNVGIAQGLDTVIDAAEELPEVCFHIVGDGTEMQRLMSKAGKNVYFHGRKPIEDMPKYYAIADAMLVTLKSDPVLSMTLPGKVQSYMAAGKPIIAAADGEISETIKSANCGFVGPAEDTNALVANIRAFIKEEDKQKMGVNSRKYYEDYFSRNRFMDELEKRLSEAINKP